MRHGSELTSEARAASAAADMLSKGSTQKFMSGGWPNISGPKTVLLGGFTPKLVVGHAPDVLSVGGDPELEVLDSAGGIVHPNQMRRTAFYACLEHPNAAREHTALGGGTCAKQQWLNKHDAYVKLEKGREPSREYKCDAATCVLCSKAERRDLDVALPCPTCSGECGTCNTGAHNINNGQVGVDGSGRVLELRPRACLSATAFLKEMQSIIHTAVRRVASGWGCDHQLNAWPFGGKIETIGAHFHFGGARACALGGANGECLQKQRFVDTALGAVLASRYFVYDWLSPFARGSVRNGNAYDSANTVTNETLARSATPYEVFMSGTLVRSQPWGLEYRELPSFLVSPKLVRAVTSALLGIWGRALGDEEFTIKLGRSLESFEQAGIPGAAAKAMMEEVVRLNEMYTKNAAVPVLAKEWDAELSTGEKAICATLMPQQRVEVRCGRCDVCRDAGVPHAPTCPGREGCEYPVHL